MFRGQVSSACNLTEQLFGRMCCVCLSFSATHTHTIYFYISFHVWGVDLCCGIYQDHGIYSGPIGSAVFIITVRLQKMKEIKDLYQRRVYTQLVGPGCCFGALTLMLRFYFQWEYAYVHSFYHLSMAVSFVLLLPKMNRYAGTDHPAKLSSTLSWDKKTPSLTIWTIPTERTPVKKGLDFSKQNGWK
uniref:Myomaker, myoblast fusion factor n=1 Tax=Oncorhynchus mykiss TaxID=8022 RepID=A0A8K9UW18_ONCMY